ncbi:leucine-rich repeat domain-containing protein [Baaleninema simplex]|uniref:leucine-rich repeat domain-containing protein n=1 Tax=Baaleninema simplex TaxID=2862350 RepID=UPI000361C686|nr:leucine-rich repeat domain-containing protein [Baaleninema simplex]
MTALLYHEFPLNPTRIERYWHDAGLAFEKHHWNLPTSKYLRTTYLFGGRPRQEAYVSQTYSEMSHAVKDEPLVIAPLSRYLTPDALPEPPLHFNCIYEPQTDAVTERFVEQVVMYWPAPVYLVFSQRILRPVNILPQHTKIWVDNIIGKSWKGNFNPGWVPLDNAQTRQKALRSLGTKKFHHLYLVAGLPEAMTQSSEVNELFKELTDKKTASLPLADYRQFHDVVSNSDWVLTTHGNVADAVPYCFYSTKSLLTLTRDSGLTPSESVEEFDDIDTFNRAAGISVPPRGGLTLSEIVPLEMVEDFTELSLAWSRLDRLDELPSLRNLEHLDLEGTAVNDLTPLTLMPQLKSLSLRCLQLKDLKPLRQIPNLEKLFLNRFPLNELSDLAEVRTLRSLILDYIPLNDLTALKGCSQIKELSLHSTPLERLDGITELSALEKLSFGLTPTKDLSPLRNLSNLKELLLEDCVLEDLSPLSTLENLTTFRLSTSATPPQQLPDLSPLESLSGLKHLDLSFTIFQKLPLGSLVNTLERLDIYGCQLEDLQGLTQFKALRHLDIEEIKAPPPEQLMALNHLESLSVCYSGIKELEWLKKFVHLRQLNLNLNKVKDLRPLENLSELRSLSLALVSVDSSKSSKSHPLEVLSSLIYLEELNVAKWELGVPTWLEALSKLRVLNLRSTDFEETTWLSGLTHLKKLNLENTPVRSLDGLSACRQLRYLNLEGTQVRHLDALRFATELEELNLSKTPIEDLSGLRGLKRLKKLDLENQSPQDCDLSVLLELPRLSVLRLEKKQINVDIEELGRRHRLIIRPT